MKAFLLFIALLCCCSNLMNNKVQIKLSQNEKDVYLAITNFDTTSFLVLLSEPYFRQIDTLFLDSVIQKDIVNDYTTTNTGFTSWNDYDFNLGVKHTIISTSTLNSIFASDTNGWVALGLKYPGSNGYWKLSKIGFNADSTKAIVYYGHQWANLGGTYSLLSLRKINNIWTAYRIYYLVES